MNALEKLGFVFSPHIKCYTAQESNSYFSRAVQIKIYETGDVSVYLVGASESKWCRDTARKAITALQSIDWERDAEAQFLKAAFKDDDGCTERCTNDCTPECWEGCAYG